MRILCILILLSIYRLVCSMFPESSFKLMVTKTIHIVHDLSNVFKPTSSSAILSFNNPFKIVFKFHCASVCLQLKMSSLCTEFPESLFFINLQVPLYLFFICPSDLLASIYNARLQNSLVSFSLGFQ